VKTTECSIKENLRKYYNQEAEYRNASTKQEWKLAERQAFLNLAKAEGKQTLLELGAGTGDDSLFFMGVYGGENTESEYVKTELSQHPRFFSYFSKDALQEVLAMQFEIISFKQYDVQRGRSHEFQSVLMRKKAMAK